MGDEIVLVVVGIGLLVGIAYGYFGGDGKVASWNTRLMYTFGLIVFVLAHMVAGILTFLCFRAWFPSLQSNFTLIYLVAVVIAIGSMIALFSPFKKLVRKITTKR